MTGPGTFDAGDIGSMEDLMEALVGPTNVDCSACGATVNKRHWELHQKWHVDLAARINEPLDKIVDRVNEHGARLRALEANGEET